MEKKLNKLIIVLVGFVLLLIYGRWFLQREIIGGDWPYFFPSVIASFPFFPPSWSFTHGNGLGGTILSYSIDSYLYASSWIFHHLFHLSWIPIYKICWYGLFIVLALSSPFYLFTVLFPTRSAAFRVLSSLIFTTNTFILMVVGGGQIGEAIAFSLTPLVLGFFVKTLSERKIFSYSLLFLIVALSFQMIIDIRIVYISVIAAFFYWVVTIWQNKSINYIFSTIPRISIPLLFSAAINAYWIFPMIVSHNTSLQSLGNAYTSSDAVKFFSFAKFENSLSFLHPNWPENIFGKVSFLNPIFLVFPILSLSSMLFLKIKKKDSFFISVVFLNIIGLVGVFLAKGAQDPFGNIYIWLFEKFPGFQFFRDPIKFYILIATSYALLIPFTLEEVSLKFIKKNQPMSKTIIIFLFVIFWCFSIQQAITGKINGTFSSRTVPKEYIALNSFFSSQPGFYRILWIPRQSRFGNFTDIHPSVEAQALFNVNSVVNVEKKLQDKSTQRMLSELSIKYIVVPYDPFAEIFVTNGKYDNNQYNKVTVSLKELSWLHQINGFGKIAVFEVPLFKDHFWLEGNGKVTYSRISSTMYRVRVSSLSPSILVFSENYNSSWVAKIGSKEIHSQKTKEGLNSFNLSYFTGNKDITIFFATDVYYIYGKYISVVSVILLLLVITVGKVKKI